VVCVPTKSKNDGILVIEKGQSEGEGFVAKGVEIGDTNSHRTSCSHRTYKHTRKALVLFEELKSRWLGHCVFVCMPPPNNTNLQHPPTPRPPPSSSTENKHTHKGKPVLTHTLLDTNSHEYIPLRAKQKFFHPGSLTHTFLDCQKPR